MQQLSELDASFLYMEHESTPVHIGAVYVLNCQHRPTPLSFAEFSAHIESRLALSPRFRQRLVEVPLRLDFPYWVDDPEFNLERHLFHLPLTNSKDQRELLSVSEQFLARPLKRSQPLWEIAFVSGLEDQANLAGTSCAIISKVHHVVLDPVTGEGPMSVLLDFTVEGIKPPKPEPWQPQPLPSAARLIGNSYSHALATPLKLASKAKDIAAATYHSVLVNRLQKLSAHPSFLSAPETVLNQPISDERSFSYHQFPLNRLKAIKKKAPGTTLNDIVMTLCSEVVLSFLAASDDEPPASPLIALSPISVRSKRIDSPTGSELSAVFQSLATTEPNLAKRLKRIHDHASASEVYGKAISANRLTNLKPSAMLGLAIRVYTKFQLAQRHKPLFNIPITNIPGPAACLYFCGAKIDYKLPTEPLFDGIGLVIMVISYAEKVTFTFTACPGIVPDLELLTKNCDNVLLQLESDLEATDFATIPDVSETESEATKPLVVLSGDLPGLFNGMLSSVLSKVKKR